MKSYIGQERYEYGKIIVVFRFIDEQSRLARTLPLSEELDDYAYGKISGRTQCGKSLEEIEKEEGIFPIGVEFLDGLIGIVANRNLTEERLKALRPSDEVFGYNRLQSECLTPYSGYVVDMNPSTTLINQIANKNNEEVERLEQQVQDKKIERNKLQKYLNPFIEKEVK